MSKLCPKCVLAVGLGLVASVFLISCVKNAHFWGLLAMVGGVGICMLLGEKLPPEDNSTELQ